MMKTILHFICALAIIPLVSCAEQREDTASTAFKIQPGDLTKFDTTIAGRGTSFNVTYGVTPYNPPGVDDYAIIVSNVNNTGNVGIAFGTNPQTERSFKVYIHYSGTISSGPKDGTATVIENGIRQSSSFAGINVTFIGPDAFNVYTITIAPMNVGVKTLSFTDLKAYLIQ